MARSLKNPPENYFVVGFVGLILTMCLTTLPAAPGQLIPASENGLTKWSPAKRPTMTGPIDVGVILILFPDTELKGGIPQFLKDLDNINGLSQEEYFKIYSNDIAWPVVKVCPDENEAHIYHAPQLYGYYCKFDYWSNPIGWHSTDDGQKRATLLKAEALREAKTRSKNLNFRATAFSFITRHISDPTSRPDIRRYYAGHCGRKPEDYPDPLAKSGKAAKSDAPDLYMGDKIFDPWAWYHPGVSWGEPMWPNSSIQMNDASAGTFAHEFGHVMGAPDLYHVGRSNDGIGGTAALLTYGPTATAFSRYYHHGFIDEKNYPTLTRSGTYTLYPRHIKPDHDEALGYIIPSRHSHYFYHIEYIYGENPALGVGTGAEGQKPRQGEYAGNTSAIEGVLISVIDLRVTSYLGSPDFFYTYRPNDPFFRGHGDVHDCLFGMMNNRTELSMTTEPSSRLPNLLDGGVVFRNITEKQGTATFDVEIDKSPLTTQEYDRSLLPQIRLEPIDGILPTSFHMTATIKFRGEPLIDQFGMCWSIGRNPEVTGEKFTLANCNGEMYQGRALNLQPNTSYHVRAWASSSKGVRYSDEELVVKTLPIKSEVTEVGPLLLDSFSNNSMLHEHFSNDSRDHYGNKTNSYEGYAPVAVLAKLAAYYHPDNLIAGHVGSSRGRPGNRELLMNADPDGRGPIDFGRLHWDPFETDPPGRKVQTMSLFEELRNQARTAKMYDPHLTNKFGTGFDRLFRYRIKPQYLQITSANMKANLKLIKNELINSRPVIVIESPKADVLGDKRIQWGLIDGFQDGDNLHIDFPLDTEFLKGKNDRLKFATMDSLLVEDYDFAVVTQISF